MWLINVLYKSGAVRSFIGFAEVDWVGAVIALGKKGIFPETNKKA